MGGKAAEDDAPGGEWAPGDLVGHMHRCWSIEATVWGHRGFVFHRVFFGGEAMISWHKLGGGNSNTFYFYPEAWGNDPIWRSFFFKWVETTNQQVILMEWGDEMGWKIKRQRILFHKPGNQQLQRGAKWFLKGVNSPSLKGLIATPVKVHVEEPFSWANQYTGMWCIRVLNVAYWSIHMGPILDVLLVYSFCVNAR